ncbi:hypothetical protein Mterra_02878 [Calidithermus terrae]|uniref:Uncharacterized protein n=1 Tax=Calidithermus terrae TaxID=1408545 RepID=A0A399EBE9_9DEIN|nr:hypothetical protein Mterra_02878 [Calidithermus terrae]
MRTPSSSTALNTVASSAVTQALKIRGRLSSSSATAT